MRRVDANTTDEEVEEIAQEYVDLMDHWYKNGGNVPPPTLELAIELLKGIREGKIRGAGITGPASQSR